MADVTKQARAKNVFDTICRMLDGEEFKYNADPQAMRIKCGARGEDLPMELTFLVDADREFVSAMSHMPFTIQEDKRLDLAIAISAINNVLISGSFDYDLSDGHILFRLTTNFKDSTLSTAVFEYMLYVSFKTIDEYNDKFLMLSKGMMTMEQFLQKL